MFNGLQQPKIGRLGNVIQGKRGESGVTKYVISYVIVEIIKVSALRLGPVAEYLFTCADAFVYNELTFIHEIWPDH